MSDDPLDPLHRFQREVERLFHSLVYQRHPSCHFTETRWAPATDLVVFERSARLIVELAGVPRESVRVRLQGDALEISGRREPPADDADADHHLAEILFGEFLRVIQLPWIADAEFVEARVREGLLVIDVRRAPDPPRTQVEIGRK